MSKEDDQNSMKDENEAALEILLSGEGPMLEGEEVPPLQEMPPEIGEEEDAFAQAMALLQQEANQEGQEHPQVQGAGQSNVTEYEEIQSPTLRDLDASRRPSRKTVCETCPNSVWFASPEEVKCYCRVMFMTIWSTKQQNVLINCDGIYLGQEE